MARESKSGDTVYHSAREYSARESKSGDAVYRSARSRDSAPLRADLETSYAFEQRNRQYRDYRRHVKK